MSRKPPPVHALLCRTTQPVYTRRSQSQAFSELWGRALVICGHHTNPQFTPFVNATPFRLAELHPRAHLVHVKEQAGSGNEAHDGNVTPRTRAANGPPGSRPRSARGSAHECSLLHEQHSAVSVLHVSPHANRSLGRASNSSTGPLHSLVPGNHFILSSRLSKQIFQDKLTDKLLSNSHFQEKILVVSPTA